MLVILEAQHEGYDCRHDDGDGDRRSHGQHRVLEDGQRQHSGIAVDIGRGPQRSRQNAAGRRPGHDADHGFLEPQVDAIERGLGDACDDTAKGQAQAFGAKRLIFGAQRNAQAGAALGHVVQDVGGAEEHVISRIGKGLHHEGRDCVMHARHHQPGHCRRQQAHGHGAKGCRGPQEEVDDNAADPVAQGAQHHDARHIGDGHGSHAHQHGAQNARDDFRQQLLDVVGADANQQRREQRAAVGDLGHGQGEDGDCALLEHVDKVGIHQCRGNRHGVERRAAQLLGHAVGHEHRHEVEGHVGQLAEENVGIGFLEGRKGQRRQQQKHLQHATRDQAGNQRRHGGGHKANDVVDHAAHGALLGRVGSLGRSAARSTALGLIDLTGRIVHRDNVLAQHDLQLVRGEHHAQYRLGGPDGLLLDGRLVADNEAQSSGAVVDGGDVPRASAEFYELFRDFPGIHGSTSFLQALILPLAF